MYTVDYFIEKFSAIPEEEWTIGVQQDQSGRRCAIGHCMSRLRRIEGLIYVGNGHKTREGRALVELLPSIAIINNGDEEGYTQATPKQRILAALRDIKRKEEPRYKDITKKLAILPTEEVSDVAMVLS